MVLHESPTSGGSSDDGSLDVLTARLTELKRSSSSGGGQSENDLAARLAALKTPSKEGDDIYGQEDDLAARLAALRTPTTPSPIHKTSVTTDDAAADDDAVDPPQRGFDYTYHDGVYDKDGFGPTSAGESRLPDSVIQESS